MFSSRRDRLQLLAGIIDSDGSYNKKANSYIIAMVTKKMINQIHTLAQSLGFHSNYSEYIAKMKRKDGSMYSTQAYKVALSGELSIIPVKVPHKKSRIRQSKRNYLTSSFKLEHCGYQNTYKIDVSGNCKQLLLKDLTVINI